MGIYLILRRKSTDSSESLHKPDVSIRENLVRAIRFLILFFCFFLSFLSLLISFRSRGERPRVFETATRFAPSLFQCTE